MAGGPWPAARLGDRALFPGLEARAYLAHAAVSPLAAPVVEAVERGVRDGAARGLAALGPWIAAADRARELFAALIGAPPHTVARLSSTSAGVSAVASGLRLGPGDRLVVFGGEFPTNVSPWQAAARRAGAEVVSCPIEPFARSHGEGLASCARLLERGAKLVAVSAVQFQTGLALPLKALADLAHAAGARLFVDAIQAVGAVPLDVGALGVDFLACGGHKWLMGPLGTAFLYLRPEAQAELDPLQVGWMSHRDADAHLFAPGQLRTDRPLREDARVFEQGVLPFVALAGSAAALELLTALGVGAIHRHLQRYHDALEPRLVAAGLRSLRSSEPGGRSGILSCAPPPGVEVAELVRTLGAQGVVVTGPDGCLRFAPHWPNPLEEVELVADAVERILVRR
jgi:cysteine desulfurase/selenocysteine lyase